MLLAFGLALMASCRGADQIAPDGSTITLAANPATIILVGGSGSSDVVATVSSGAGVPLKDQDVRFSATAGSLFDADGNPAANIPIRTDDLGNAHVTLVTTTTTTVTAKSGKATGSLSLSTVNGNLSAILINQVFTAGCLTDSTFTSCSDKLCLEAQAVDDEGNGIAGVVLVFSLDNETSTAGGTFGGVFSPATQATTDAGGFARASFQIASSSCTTTCSGGESCEGDLLAALQGGGFPAIPLHFTTNIP
jgi:hypothetical protein